jgi:hypothetical protein
MGASISFDSKYKLILDAEVECISNAKPSASKKSASKSKSKTATPASDSESASESGSGSGSGSGSESGSDSGSDSEDETKIFTVKLTPEIIGYIRTYIRDNDFLDIMDTITEIELNEYGHGPDSALVFDAQSVIYNINDNKIEASGEWEYIAATPIKTTPTISTKSSRKHKSKGGRSRDDNNDNDDNDNDDDDDSRSKKNNNNGFKTKEDELALSEIENIISERFKEYSKHRDFVIHESKTSTLILNIHSVEIVKD